MSTEGFYSALLPLQDFIELTNPDNYASIPHDWYALITDVVGSTQAIEAGRYRDVNLLGASCIIAVLNAIGSLEVPFVFGGDGASILVPPSVVVQAREALLAIRALAHSSFGLNLRVGVVPVEVIIPNYPLKVAKFEVTENYHQASFIGGGLTYATDLMKADRTYQVESNHSTSKANLSGLECRWQDVLSRHGQTVSLIVAAMPSGGKLSGEVYREVIQKIQQLYGEPKDYHPITTSALKLTFNPHKLRAEAKARVELNDVWNRSFYLFKVIIENLLGLYFMQFSIKLGNVNWGLYKVEVLAASDHQKIDDVLRMVIAGKPAQTDQLMQYLEQQFRAGYLTYGVHISDRALMTCLIFEQRDRHIHLVDGADGGYAFAAKSLKAQLRRKAANWKTYLELVERRNQQR